ncbi:MAG: hypothetical protein COB02_06850 [Candidatus Cloacimonadota bacterium]|nr:MAG: hypothetical protein COB02_06850 [Candidatus Cloacimonadota bacterium]
MIQFLLFILLSTFIYPNQSSILETKLNFEDISPPNNYSLKLQDFHLKGLDLLNSVWLFKNTSSSSVVAYIINEDDALSDKTFSQIKSSTIKDNLLKYYEKRLNISFDNEKDTKDKYDFMWRELPTFDDYQNSYSVNFVITKNGLNFWEYMKLIFLTKSGFCALEWDQPYSSQNLKLFKQLKNDVKTTSKSAYNRNNRNPLPQYTKSLKKAVLPIFSQKILNEIQNDEQSFLEKNRKSLGIFILFFSMIFFVFILPKIK